MSLGLSVTAIEDDQTDIDVATKILNRYFNAMHEGKYEQLTQHRTPKITTYISQLAGMSSLEIRKQLAAKMRGAIDHTKTVLLPDYDRACMHETRDGRPYLKLPVYMKLVTGTDTFFERTTTFICYREGKNWYPLELSPTETARALPKIYQDFRAPKAT